MAKSKSKARQARQARQLQARMDREFASVTADVTLRPSSVIAVYCPICSTQLEANLVHHSATMASRSEDEATGLVCELTFFAEHACGSVDE